jgi:hypothetical protein
MVRRVAELVQENKLYFEEFRRCGSFLDTLGTLLER